MDRLWGLPPRAAAQLPRLCPNLREVYADSGAPADAAADLRGLAAARGLEALCLSCMPPFAADTKGGAEAAAALAALTGLRRLAMQLGGELQAARNATAELLAALTSLTRLTSLTVAAGYDGRAPPPLRGCPDSLAELALGNSHAVWGAPALEGVPPLPGVTKLQLHG